MTKKILVIEDDTSLRRNMKLVLESEGYVVTLAENGQVALDYLIKETELPQLILLDLQMPIMDGFQFRVAQISDPRLSQIPVVVLTADGHLQEKQTRVGASFALKKPADIDAILDAVEKYSA